MKQDGTQADRAALTLLIHPVTGEPAARQTPVAVVPAALAERTRAALSHRLAAVWPRAQVLVADAAKLGRATFDDWSAQCREQGEGQIGWARRVCAELVQSFDAPASEGKPARKKRGAKPKYTDREIAIGLEWHHTRRNVPGATAAEFAERHGLTVPGLERVTKAAVQRRNRQAAG